MTIVAGAQCMVADPLRVLSWITPLDTDWTRPSTWSLPAGGGGGAGGGAALGGELGGFADTVGVPLVAAGGGLFVEAYTATHIAAAARETARIANRVMGTRIPNKPRVSRPAVLWIGCEMIRRGHQPQSGSG